MKETLFYMTRSQLVSLLFIMTIYYVLCSLAGLRGTAGFAITLPWFFKYSFVIAEQTSMGFKEPPVLSYEMIRIFDNMRIYKELFAIAFLLNLGYGIYLWLGLIGAMFFLLLCILVFPAFLAILVQTDDLLSAITPSHVGTILRHGGWPYVRLVLIFAGLVLGYPTIFASESSGSIIKSWAYFEVWYHLSDTIIMWFFFLLGHLLFFHLLGKMLYQRRHVLDVLVAYSPELNEKEQEKKKTQAHENIIRLLVRLDNVGEWQQAREILSQYLAQEEDALPAAKWFLERMVQWDDDRLAKFVGEVTVSYLVASDRMGEAIDFCVTCFQILPQWHPKEHDALMLSSHAKKLGKTPLVEKLLTPYRTHWLQSAHAPEALWTLVQHAIAQHEFDKVGHLVQEFLTQFPDHALTERMKAFATLKNR